LQLAPIRARSVCRSDLEAGIDWPLNDDLGRCLRIRDHHRKVFAVDSTVRTCCGVSSLAGGELQASLISRLVLAGCLIKRSVRASPPSKAAPPILLQVQEHLGQVKDREGQVLILALRVGHALRSNLCHVDAVADVMLEITESLRMDFVSGAFFG
jgi:hypothetical protein